MKILRHNSCCTFDSRSTVDVKSYRVNDFFAKNGRKYGDDDDDDGAVIKRNLSRSGNHIYFYDVIDTQTQMWLQTQMTAAYEEYVISNAKELAHSHSITENIYLHINSPGGSVTSALALYDFIKSFPMVCVGIVEGACRKCQFVCAGACAKCSARRIPNASPSNNELLARRLAPWTPLHAASPTAYKPRSDVCPTSSVKMPPIKKWLPGAIGIRCVDSGTSAR